MSGQFKEGDLLITNNDEVPPHQKGIAIFLTYDDREMIRVKWLYGGYGYEQFAYYSHYFISLNLGKDNKLLRLVYE